MAKNIYNRIKAALAEKGKTNKELAGALAMHQKRFLAGVQIILNHL